MKELLNKQEANVKNLIEEVLSKREAEWEEAHDPDIQYDRKMAELEIEHERWLEQKDREWEEALEAHLNKLDREAEAVQNKDTLKSKPDHKSHL
jgi:hypothetical protein